MRNVTGRTENPSASRIQNACASSARSGENRPPPLAAPSPASSAATSAGDPASRTARTQRSRRARSEEHTSELQSRENLVCRLLLEKKNKTLLDYQYWLKLGGER